MIERKTLKSVVYERAKEKKRERESYSCVIKYPYNIDIFKAFQFFSHLIFNQKLGAKSYEKF